MYSFKNDYSESAHPSILHRLVKMELEQNSGYGMDKHCANAKKLIQTYLQCDSVDIHFLPGGTIANLTVLSHLLKPYEAVISSTTGHINVHECGAIEATGHKVITPPIDDGKLTKELIEPILSDHQDEFCVHPSVVYISNPTEIGTIYTKQELETLYTYCKEKNLLLFIDGARLPMALGVPESGLTMADFQNLCDVLFIGGTKVGALFGEAIAIFNEELKPRFRFSMKQHGAMLAKGWLLGVQFEELFTDGLYLRLGAHADNMAMLLKYALLEAGIPFLTDSPTNQQFPILPNDLKAMIEEKYEISDWSTPDETHTCVRFCTSWATKESDVLQFIEDFKQMMQSLKK